MQVVFGRGRVEVSTELVESLLQQVQAVLGRIDQRLRLVRVWVDDLNGQRGGIDKRCVLEALLMPRGRLVVDALDSEVIAAVDRAARTLRQRICRRFEQARDLRRRPRTRWQDRNELKHEKMEE